MLNVSKVSKVDKNKTLINNLLNPFYSFLIFFHFFRFLVLAASYLINISAYWNKIIFPYPLPPYSLNSIEIIKEFGLRVGVVNAENSRSGIFQDVNNKIFSYLFKSSHETKFF